MATGLWQTLPPEVLGRILALLDSADQGAVAQACKAWKRYVGISVRKLCITPSALPPEPYSNTGQLASRLYTLASRFPNLEALHLHHAAGKNATAPSYSPQAQQHCGVALLHAPLWDRLSSMSQLTAVSFDSMWQEANIQMPHHNDSLTAWLVHVPSLLHLDLAGALYANATRLGWASMSICCAVVSAVCTYRWPLSHMHRICGCCMSFNVQPCLVMMQVTCVLAPTS